MLLHWEVTFLLSFPAILFRRKSLCEVRASGVGATFWLWGWSNHLNYSEVFQIRNLSICHLFMYSSLIFHFISKFRVKFISSKMFLKIHGKSADSNFLCSYLNLVWLLIEQLVYIKSWSADDIKTSLPAEIILRVGQKYLHWEANKSYGERSKCFGNTEKTPNPSRMLETRGLGLRWVSFLGIENTQTQSSLLGSQVLTNPLKILNNDLCISVW